MRIIKRKNFIKPAMNSMDNAVSILKNKNTNIMQYASNIKMEDVKFNINRPKNNKCVIVIPVYKNILSKFETSSLKQVYNILGKKYDIILVCPDSFELDLYKSIIGKELHHVYFPSHYFLSQRSYSNLCLQSEFYEIFNSYEYMLIYQLDAWIFEDNLEYFCNLDYDYIGAPHLWVGEKAKVGNGGFSLRKISKLIEACNLRDLTKDILLEDRVLTEKINILNIAPLEIALEFSWQDNPSKALKKNNDKLPMGAHAIMRYSYFWRKYINNL